MKKFTVFLSSLACLSIISCTPSSTGTGEDITNPVIKDKKYPAAFQYKNSKTIVISPYRPYNRIDVKGLKPGHLARDMSTAKKDSSGKPITSSAKIFRVPEYKPVSAQ